MDALTDKLASAATGDDLIAVLAATPRRSMDFCTFTIEQKNLDDPALRAFLDRHPVLGFHAERANMASHPALLAAIRRISP